MSYKFSKGSQVIGDLKAADDTQRDTKIDFEEDYIALHTSGSAVLVVSGSKVGVDVVNPSHKLDVNGDIRVRGNDIRDNSGNPAITFDGSANTTIVNNLTVQNYTFPASDGNADQVLQTNGSGQLTFVDVDGGGGGGGSSTSNRSVYMGYVSLQTTSRVVSYDLGANLGPTANNNFKGMIIVPFDGTLDTVIISPKGTDVTTANFGNITVSAFKNQSNFASGTDVVVAGDNFQRKTPDGSTNPKIFSGEFDFNLSVSAGDLIQIKVGRSSGGTTDTLVTVVFTET
jgi:hypothetical protein